MESSTLLHLAFAGSVSHHFPEQKNKRCTCFITQLVYSFQSILTTFKYREQNMKKLLQLLSLALLLTLTACAHLPAHLPAHSQNGETSGVSDNTVIKSPNDSRQYEYLVLPNQMKVLLISDPEADKAAAALTVGVGSSSNPRDREGLAHFLEHMLFLGTEKYPDPDEYSKFINSNGGSQNAFTAPNITTYFFDIKQEALEQTLDRFSQFFVSPLFTSEFVDREKNAVHSEYMLKIKDKYRRGMAAQRQVYDPSSPYSMFSVGNLDTLSDKDGKPIRADLIDFYNAHYSSNIMTLAILGKESLPQLKSWAVDKFSAVPNRHTSRMVPKVKLLGDRQLPVRVNIKSLQEIYLLSLEFAVNSVISDYKKQPLRYLSYFIGHEGKGSLLALLKNKGWATGLSAGSQNLDSIESIMTTSIDLTKEGYQHIDTIVEYFFDYVELLQNKGIEEWRFSETRQMAELGFRFSEKASPSSMVVGLSGTMQDYPAVDLLRKYIPQTYDAELIKQFAQQLQPKNMMLTVESKNIETDQTEALYQVDYSIKNISADTLKQWVKPGSDVALSLPQPNPYIPEETAIKQIATAKPIPEKINNHDGFSIWHQQENAFGVPRAEFLVGIKTPYANDSAKHAIMKELLIKLLNEQLKNITYSASLAGLNASLQPASTGLLIMVSGYDQKQPLILEEVIQVLKNPNITQDLFLTYSNKMRQSLENAKFNKPFRQVISARKRYMVKPSWSTDELLNALEVTSLTDLQNYLPKLLEKAEVKILSYGNITADETLQLSTLLKSELLNKTRLGEVADPDLTILPHDRVNKQNFEVDHPDSVILTTYQGNGESIDEQAKWKLLGQMLGAPFYSDLRTRQQLGYVVFAGYSESEKVPELILLAQSSTVNSTELEKRIDAFTTNFIQEIEQMSAADFSTHKAGVISSLMKRDQKMHDRVSRYITNLSKDNFSFDLNKKLADAINKLDQGSMITFYRKSVLENPAKLVFRDHGTRFGSTIQNQ